MITFKQELAALHRAVTTAQAEAAAAELDRANQPPRAEMRKRRADELAHRIAIVIDYLGNRPANRPWATIAKISEDIGIDHRIATQTIIKLRRAGKVKAKPRNRSAREWMLASAEAAR